MTFLFTKEAKWYRVAFFAVVFMVIPALLEQSFTSYWRHYYETAPISNFYEAMAFEAENICTGDITQDIKTVRFVNGTESGWAADIIRELYKVNDAKLKAKIYEENANVFIEKIPDGMSSREAAIPPLKAGVYQWEVVIIRLYLPYGVVRVTSPSLISNTFSVTDCGNK